MYRYVGPPEIASRTVGQSGLVIESVRSIDAWLRSNGPRLRMGELLAVTFVIDLNGRLLIADRHSEHVACAGGAPVLSAGELFFRDGEVVETSNQSTGYCPEPESWPVVAAALDHAGIVHPGQFTTAVIFRRCRVCGQRNIVRDSWFECGVCRTELPKEWNFDTPFSLDGGEQTS